MSTGSRPNVLLIVIDACRADHLEPYGADLETPAATSLARDGTVFRRALSPAPWTLPSTTSLLTGLDSSEHGATARHFAPRNGRPLQQELATVGYRTLHLSPTTWIGDWLPQGSGFDRVDEFTGPTHRYFERGCDVRDLSKGVARGPEWYTTVIRRALTSETPLRSLGNAAAFKAAEATGDAWLDDVNASERAVQVADERFAEAADDDRPFFAYVHLMDPHLPFYVPDAFRTDSIRPPECDDYEDELEYMRALMDDIWAVRTGKRTLSSAECRYLRTRYADEVRYADHAVGQLLERLREHGLADETLVALTADHGEHLGERVEGRTLIDHQASIQLPLLRVPLILRYPDVFGGGERDDLVQPHYLAETIRAFAGPEYDRSRSLHPEDDPRTVARSSYEGIVRSHPPNGVPTDALFRRRRTAVTDKWKLDCVGDEYRAYRIDWASTETEPIALKELPKPIGRQLRETIDAIDERTESTEPEAEGRSMPAAVEERLSRLGYR